MSRQEGRTSLHSHSHSHPQQAFAEMLEMFWRNTHHDACLVSSSFWFSFIIFCTTAEHRTFLGARMPRSGIASSALSCRTGGTDCRLNPRPEHRFCLVLFRRAREPSSFVSAPLRNRCLTFDVGSVWVQKFAGGHASLRARHGWGRCEEYT